MNVGPWGQGDGGRGKRASRSAVRALIAGWSAVVVGALLFGGPAAAHEFKPGLLALVERAGGTYDVTWRLPAEDAGYPLRPVFPPGASRLPGGTRTREGDAVVERFSVVRPAGLSGQTLRLGGVAPGITEILVRVEGRGGQVVTGRLSTKQPAFTIPAAASALAVAGSYLVLGIEHILTGLDHLAFVFLLVLLAPQLRAVVRAVTAFTVAHSLTLALAALGVVQVPQAPVEATIALSILLLARQLMVRNRAGRTAGTGAMDRTVAPWLSAFGFGLLHGLGFAGALSSVGLPGRDIPLALFCFNLGVEAGQLAFVAVVLLVRRAVLTLLASPTAVRGNAPWIQRLAALPVWAVGSMAAFWLIERVTAFFD